MSSRHSTLALAVRSGLFALVLPAVALAQDPPASDEAVLLDTIVVTAQKREQQVHEVPIAISAYSGEFLDRVGATEMKDLGNLVPGLEIQEQSPNNPSFAIRGLTSDSGEAYIEPRVSVFQDGVSISKSRGSIVQPFDLQRVEVLRGPQGTLFGRGAQIGAVHLIQNKAFHGYESRFSIGLGDYATRHFSAMANAPLSDALAARIAVFHESNEGFVENLSGGRLNGKDTIALRVSFGLDLGEANRLDLIVNHQTDSGPGTAFRSGTIPTRRGSLNVFDRTADLNRGTQLGLDRSVNGVTLLGQFALTNAWSLSTTSGWRNFASVEEFDADGSQIAALEFAEDTDGTQVSQEFRFNYDHGGNFRGFAGASYFHADGRQRVPFQTDERSLYALLSPVLNRASGGRLPRIPVLRPDLTPNLAAPPALPNLGIPGFPAFIPLKPLHREEYSNFGEVKAAEAFADGTWSINDRIDLTAGLRATREDVRSGYEARYFGVPSALGQFLPDPPSNRGFPNILLRPVARVNAEDTYTSVVGRAVVSYRFSDVLNGYASISRGRRPNVIQFAAGNDGTPEFLPAEIVLSYELGLKGSVFSNALSYDLAVFQYDYSNFQTSVPPPAGVGFINTNAGNAAATGAELSLLYRANESLSAFFNYGYIDASFDDRDDAGRPQRFTGNRFRLTPEHSAAAGIDWSFAVADGMAMYLRPSWNWRSQVYFEDLNTPGIEQAGYALVDLRAGLRFGEGRWDLGVYVRNISNRDYLIDAGNTGRLFGTPTFIVGTPRTYGLTLSGRF